MYLMLSFITECVGGSKTATLYTLAIGVEVLVLASLTVPTMRGLAIRERTRRQKALDELRQEFLPHVSLPTLLS